MAKKLVNHGKNCECAIKRDSVDKAKELMEKMLAGAPGYIFVGTMVHEGKGSIKHEAIHSAHNVIGSEVLKSITSSIK